MLLSTKLILGSSGHTKIILHSRLKWQFTFHYVSDIAYYYEAIFSHHTINNGMTMKMWHYNIKKEEEVEEGNFACIQD